MVENKKKQFTQQKVSIITIVRNGENYIKTTIKSVINQTYQNIEYIIIDGLSDDRTIDTSIKECRSFFT